jgi:hypothetical protein
MSILISHKKVYETSPEAAAMHTLFDHPFTQLNYIISLTVLPAPANAGKGL